jgi:hypothetical protein
MSDTLKPCPFCGAELVIQNGEDDWKYAVCTGCTFSSGEYLNEAILKKVLNHRPSGWISVKDRLPEKTGRYIVHQWRTGETSDCDYYHRDDPYTTFPGWEYEQEKISHWMPCPPDPEEEE